MAAAKNMPFMKIRFLSGVLALAALGCAGSAYAEKADRMKPMNIEADQGQHDELKQTSVFTGNVVVTKGTIVIRGEKLEVSQDRDGYQRGVVTAGAGKLAFFRQKRDTLPGAPAEYIEGEGDVITYDGRDDTVHLNGHAELRRYRETTLTDQVSGSVIVYNNLSDTFTVNGQKFAQASGSKPGAVKGDRVRVMLSPKDSQDAGPASSGAKSPAASTGTQLRSSPQLGEGTK